jgi:membrane protease YdiL (CAAX protease family)
MIPKLLFVPNKKELRAGLIYMLLEMLVLPTVLVLASMLLLPEPVSDTVLNIVYFILNFLVTVLIFRKFIRHTLSSVSLCDKSIPGSAAIGFLIYYLGNILVNMVVLSLDPEFLNVNDENITAMAAEHFGLMALCGVLLVPITEELLFRGVLFAGLYNRSRSLAFGVSTAVFCVIHVTAYIGLYPPQTLLLCLLQYIPAGLALGFAYARSGSILAPMLLHICINGIGMLVMR